MRRSTRIKVLTGGILAILLPVVFIGIWSIFWWDEYQCSANAFVQSEADAVEAALPIAMNAYKEVFSQQSIFTTSELTAAYPDCCKARAPTAGEQAQISNKFGWVAAIAVTSPCSKRKVAIMVPVDRCGSTDHPWLARLDDKPEPAADSTADAGGDDLCRG